jgi:cation diffusion facilitator family transporter
MSTHSSDGSIKAIFYALGANAGIALFKFGAAFFTGSGAMMAEAIHSVSDCANQGLLLLGIRQAKAPETEDHPLGHHRVVYFWAMMVALLLFFVGGLFSLYEGIHRITHPQPVQNTLVALGILAVSMALEGASLFGALKEIKKVSGGKPFFRWFRETRQSEMMVVTGEEIAALAGLTVAFVAVALTALTGNTLFDALGSCAVGILLITVAILLLRELKGLIVGESVSPELRSEIALYVQDQPEVARVFRVITLAQGDRMMIAVKAQMKEEASVQKMVDDINLVEERIQAKFPSASWVFFEPDVK